MVCGEPSACQELRLATSFLGSSVWQRLMSRKSKGKRFDPYLFQRASQRLQGVDVTINLERRYCFRLRDICRVFDSEHFMATM